MRSPTQEEWVLILMSLFIAQVDHNSHSKTTNKRLKFAMTYAAKMGWTVFPVPIGSKKSHKSAEHCDGRKWGQTRDADEIKADWAKWDDANIGIPCGRDNGIWVLEIDTAAGHGVDGFTSLATLEAQYGRLPKTLQAISPSGSVHYYFKYPQGDLEIKNSTSAVGIGIDVRGDGGMVIAPPSVKPGKGIYRWHRITTIADAPDWLIELVKYREPEITEEDLTTSHWTTTQDFERLKRALESISANCSYEIWFEVLCALKNAFGDAARGLAQVWSMGGTKYNSRDFDTQWKSIRSGSYNFGLGTIFYHAKENSKCLLGLKLIN